MSLLYDLSDDPNGDNPFHVTDDETTEGRILVECFHAHGLLRHDLDHGCITRLDGFGIRLQLSAGTPVDL